MLTKRILAGLAFAACAAFMIPSEVEASGRYGGGYGNHSQGQGFAGQNCRQVSPRHVQCTRRVYRSSRTYGHASRSRQTYGGYAQERPIAARPVYNKPRRAAATTCCRSASPTVATASANANGNGGNGSGNGNGNHVTIYVDGARVSTSSAATTAAAPPQANVNPVVAPVFVSDPGYLAQKLPEGRCAAPQNSPHAGQIGYLWPDTNCRSSPPPPNS